MTQLSVSLQLCLCMVRSGFAHCARKPSAFNTACMSTPTRRFLALKGWFNIACMFSGSLLPLAVFDAGALAGAQLWPSHSLNAGAGQNIDNKIIMSGEQTLRERRLAAETHKTARAVSADLTEGSTVSRLSQRAYIAPWRQANEF